jgi:hypothetical protein
VDARESMPRRGLCSIVWSCDLASQKYEPEFAVGGCYPFTGFIIYRRTGLPPFCLFAASLKSDLSAQSKTSIDLSSNIHLLGINFTPEKATIRKRGYFSTRSTIHSCGYMPRHLPFAPPTIAALSHKQSHPISTNHPPRYINKAGKYAC